MKHLLGSGEREVLLTGILSWLRINIDFFEPPQEDDILDVAPEEIRPDKRRKAFGELGAALRLTMRVPNLARNPEIRWLINAWVNLANRRQIFFDIRRRVHLFPQCAVAYAVLKALGRSAEEVGRSLQTVLNRGFIDRVEISAWNKLDMKYYLDLAGLQHGFADDVTLLNESTLTSLPNLPYATNYDLYGLTHLLFHFSDFGLKDVRPLLGRHFDHICRYTGLALSMCLSRQDWDLTAELLMNRLCLGVSDNPLDREAAHALCEYQQSTGFLPGRAWMQGTIDGEGAEDRDEQEFFDVYHPTLLGLFFICCDAQTK
jgi:hypothetical protein